MRVALGCHRRRTKGSALRLTRSQARASLGTQSHERFARTRRWYGCTSLAAFRMRLFNDLRLRGYGKFSFWR